LIPEDYDPFAPDEPAPPAKQPQRPLAPSVAEPPRAPKAAVRPTQSAAAKTSGAAPAADLPSGLRVAPRPSSVSSGPASARPGSSFKPDASPAQAAPAARAAAVAPPPPDSRPRARPGPVPYPADRPAAEASHAPAGFPSEAAAARGGIGEPGGDLDFAALLAAAGIDSARVTPELSRQFGQILRVVVSGLMDVLRAREKIKDEFRMRATNFKATDNNPLKFSANVEDALHNLLMKRNPAYLGPVEAFEDAFEDLRNHQMAILAGMRVAYASMLAEFDPAPLQEEFDRQVRSGSFLSGSAKQKYWDLYRIRFHDMVKDADTSFRRLFGDDFGKAYEEQLLRLRALKPADRS